jgi:hypothetical protein
VDLPGAKFGSQWLIEPPYKPPLLHRQKSWHLRLSCQRRRFVGLREEELAEDVDRGKDDDWRKVGIVAGLIEQFPSFLDLGRRQGDEVVGPAHGLWDCVGGGQAASWSRARAIKLSSGVLQVASRERERRAMSLRAARSNEVQRRGKIE